MEAEELRTYVQSWTLLRPSFLSLYLYEGQESFQHIIGGTPLSRKIAIFGHLTMQSFDLELFFSCLIDYEVKIPQQFLIRRGSSSQCK